MTETDTGTGTGTVRDPVCGMEVDAITAVSSTEYEGTTYYFCSEDCYRTFTQNPAQFANA